MKFEIDKQTLDDLALLKNNGDGGSILDIFNKTATYGGGDKLREFFNSPLTDAGQIRQRIDAIAYLQQNDVGFVCDKGAFDFIEHYLQQGNRPMSISPIRAIEKWIVYRLRGDSSYYVINRGIEYLLEALQQLDNFTVSNNRDLMPELLQRFHSTISSILSDDDFKPVLKLGAQKKLGAIDIARADLLFRYLGSSKLKSLLDMVYELDVLIALAAVGKKMGYTLPVVRTGNEQVLLVEGLFHPMISQPVLNDIAFNPDQNICFVTGANMAGKSTLLKSVGICVFLAHIGFPVPAARMETSVFNGLITTINLGDNIGSGSSHFYNEVLRVKHVAQKIGQSGRLLVIFDELFRGTNVKDAYDASLAIIKAFARISDSFFIISTHIVEIANELTSISNINFRFMETTFEDGSPKFSYQLRDGITEERMGMWIVNNEGIVDIINDFLNKK